MLETLLRGIRVGVSSMDEKNWKNRTFCCDTRVTSTIISEILPGCRVGCLPSAPPDPCGSAADEDMTARDDAAPRAGKRLGFFPRRQSQRAGQVARRHLSTVRCHQRRCGGFEWDRWKAISVRGGWWVVGDARWVPQATHVGERALVLT